MAAPTTINPDDFLETPEGRVWTVERNEEAWRLSYAALERALELAPALMRVVVVCGIQGASKSTWIASQPASPSTIYFDAALPGVRHRAKVISIAQRLGSSVEAVWIDTPLDVAIERNAARSPDKVVPTPAIVAVAQQFEEPTAAEGFDHVAVFDGGR
ncbi:AAA family ATPase [Sphingomonas adhaesiva]|uniref:AAA family ATPase n=1 Tax=Sphingomonas adhaesiva TaxID=28212 RepID=UPI0008368130|nr:AAA family ATPase [Sphingomonas adhaesiva]